MNRYAKIMVIGWVIIALPLNDAMARGGRGGGGGGGGGGRSFSGGGGGGGHSFSGGGGASRSYARPAPSYNRSPTMNRSMPSHAARPSASPARSPVSARPSNRPARPTNPGGHVTPGGRGTRPGANTRPVAGVQPGGHANRSQLQGFLDIPKQGGGLQQGHGRPGTVAGANSAVADFLGNSPSNRPADRRATGDTVAGNRSGRLDQRTDGRSDLRDSRGENRDFASDNRQGRTSDRGDRQSVRVDNRGDLRSSLAEGRGDRHTTRQQQRGEHADHIRNELNNRYDHDHLFNDFWSDHPHSHYHFHQNPVFWTWASFSTVSTFMPWNWGSEAAYDYGSGGNVYYEGDTVYVGTEEIPAEEYAAQAEQIATTVPEVENPDEMDWLPLGVFALTQDENADVLPNMFIQLAVSKEGILAGTYQNKTTGKTQSVEGMVDRESQRAAWTIVDKNTPILETGISNLTQNEASVLVHFADGKTQQWLMVRIENPDAEAETP